MAVGVEAQISRALQERVRSLILSPALSIAYPDVGFEKPQSNGVPLPYLEVKIFRAATDTLGVQHQSSNRQAGILQIDVMFPQDSGDIEPTEICDLVASHFKRGTRMVDGSTTVHVDLAPTKMTPLKMPPYVSHPVSIRWHSFNRQT
jgi:hypothetical protein